MVFVRYVAFTVSDVIRQSSKSRETLFRPNTAFSSVSSFGSFVWCSDGREQHLTRGQLTPLSKQRSARYMRFGAEIVTLQGCFAVGFPLNGKHPFRLENS